MTYNPSPPNPFALAQDAVRVAADNKAAALLEYTRLSEQLRKTPAQIGGLPTEGGGTYGADTNPAYTTLNAQVLRAQQMYDSASREHNDALAKLSDVASKELARNDPNTRVIAQEVLRKAKADTDRAEADLKEWNAAAPDRKAETAANIRLRTLQASQADLDQQFQTETDPTRKAALQEQLKQSQVATQQAQANLDLFKQTAGNQVTLSGQAVTAGGIANQTSQANLDNLLRQVRQAPTDAQAMEALQTALAQGQANVAATTAGTAATEASTAGTKATTEQTQFDTNVKKLGTLAGLDEFITAQKDAIAKGHMTADQADQALTARISGTDPYTATQAAENATMGRYNSAVTQRGQDVGAVSAARGNYTSAATSAFGTTSSAASKAPHGSGDALAGGYEAMLNGITNRFGGPSAFIPPASVQAPQLPPMLQKFAGQPQGQSPAIPGPGAAGPVTINVTTAPAQSPAQTAPSFTPMAGETAAASQARNPQGMPSFLQNKMPVTPDDVVARYPEAAARAGYRVQQGGMA